MDGRTEERTGAGADAGGGWVVRWGQGGRRIEEWRQRAADDAIDEGGLGAECRRYVEVRRAIIMEGGRRKHFLQQPPSKKAEILRTKEHATDRRTEGRPRKGRLGVFFT